MYTQEYLEAVEKAICDLQSGKRVTSVSYGDTHVQYAPINLDELLKLRSQILAGFPCQSFSVAGLKKGFADERGQAFFEIERILKAKKPKVLLLENVPNLKNINNGEVFQLMLEHLKELGYKVNYEILSGKDFGVPQNRRRLYIVGSLDHSKNFGFRNS